MPFIVYGTLLYVFSYDDHCYLKRISRDEIMLGEIVLKSYKGSCLLSFSDFTIRQCYDFRNI